MTPKKIAYLSIIGAISLIINDLYGQNLTVTPAQINFNLQAGERMKTEITIRNTANTQQTVQVSAGSWDIQPDGETKLDDAEGKAAAFSCADWLTIFPSLVALKPNESKKISLEMSVPQDATNARWGMLYVNPAEEQSGDKPADKSLNVGAKVISRIGIPVYQSPRTGGTYLADIQNLKEITTETDSLLRFQVEIQNKGDRVIEAQVFVVASNLATGKEFENGVLKIVVLPEHLRILTFTLSPNLPKGNYLLTTVMDYHEEADQEGTKLEIEIR